jgi:DUF4097 and DUF4098 domain-containing protein YvlB
MMKVRMRGVSGWLVRVALAVAIAASPVFAGSSEGHFDRTLNVTGIVDLDVQTGSGDITLRTGDSSKVEIHAKIHGSGWGDVEQHIHEIENNPPIEQNGNTVRIGHIENRDWKHNISISYELIVPSQTKLRSESGSGDQRADGISGPADMNSGSGSLHVKNIGGEVRARTGSGDIELDTVRGNAQASAGSGTIRATGIGGGLSASSGSGDVKLEQTAAGDVEISTGSGDVEMKGVKGGAKVTTGSGSITAQGDPTGDWRLHSGSGNVSVDFPPQAAFNLVARTSSGNIETAHEISVQGKIGARELQGKVGAGGPLVELRTSSGTIEIR